MSQKQKFISTRKGVTYLDLFAGAGGFSEGFLQAYTQDKYYDFRLASDINENCELTHRARYNKVLGLDTKFICQDIMDNSFLTNLKKAIGNQEIDVVTGGPSCQSFSLAGRRKKLDKRDDLFYHYLKVIRLLKPKYFVMENVIGILTKYNGQIKKRILKEIRSIVDEQEMPHLYIFLESCIKPRIDATLFQCISWQIHITCSKKNSNKYKEFFYKNLDQQFTNLTRSLVYNISKNDKDVNTVRHGLLLQKMKSQRSAIAKQLIQLKTSANIDNDHFVDNYNAMTEQISDEKILENMFIAIDNIAKTSENKDEWEVFKKSLEVLSFTFDECVDLIGTLLQDSKTLLAEFDKVLRTVRLYNINEPMVLLSSNYGVPQNRERVVFIGCRKDQTIITEIKPTVTADQKVKVYEALWDLDMIGNGETVITYKKPRTIPLYEKEKKKRSVYGVPEQGGCLFSQWSRTGRLSHRFSFDVNPFYVLRLSDLDQQNKHKYMELFNHQTSVQSENVRKRLKIIAQYGDYKKAQDELKLKNLDSKKRNYTVLNPLGQSSTICTMPDDYIHYASFRPMTVREMARIQSFDDSFVFQGKRQTGGNNRQKEIPQYTLVGNAVPPLVARAIGETILKHIK